MTSERQKLANALNPLKHGKYAKKVNPAVLEFMKNPGILGEKMKNIAEALEKGDLDYKEQIQYGKLLTDIYRVLHGQKQENLNVNIEITDEQINQKVYELVTNIKDGTGS